MIRRWIMPIVVCLLFFCSPILLAQDMPGKQIVTGTSGAVVIAKVEGKAIIVHSLAILATSTTSVQFYLYNEDHHLLGNSTTKLTVDLDGIDGPAGFILPYSEVGWFRTDAVYEDVKISLSSATAVIILVNYSYR